MQFSKTKLSVLNPMNSLQSNHGYKWCSKCPPSAFTHSRSRVAYATDNHAVLIKTKVTIIHCTVDFRSRRLWMHATKISRPIFLVCRFILANKPLKSVTHRRGEVPVILYLTDAKHVVDAVSVSVNSCSVELRCCCRNDTTSHNSATQQIGNHDNCFELTTWYFHSTNQFSH